MKTFRKGIFALVAVISFAIPEGTSLAQDPPRSPLLEGAIMIKRNPDRLTSPRPAGEEQLTAQTDAEVLDLEKRAEEAFLENRFQDSVKIYTQAIGKALDRSSLYFGRAMALEMLRRPKKAVEDYERALKLDPDNYWAMEGLAGILEREGRDIGRAIILYDRALARDPRSEWKENLAVWIKMLQSRLRLPDSSPIALWKQGNREAQEGKASEALALYTKAIALDPLFYQAYYRRGLVRVEQGDLKGALKDLDATVGLSPELRGALIQRGLIHEHLGNDEQALEDLMRAAEIDSRDPFAHYHLGRLSEKHGLYVDASYSYKQALKLKPKPELRNRLQHRMAVVRNPVKLALQQRSRIRRIMKELW